MVSHRRTSMTFVIIRAPRFAFSGQRTVIGSEGIQTYPGPARADRNKIKVSLSFLASGRMVK